jgi:hypothetical protein
MLPIAEFAHNSWKHDVTRKTLHELLTGIRPQVKVELIKENVPAALDRLAELEEARKLAQERLEACQQVRDTKKGQQWAEMEEGDQVWLEAKNFKVKGAKKLMPRRYGPFKITKKISPVAYQLNLPQSMKIHDVFCYDSRKTRRSARPPRTNDAGKDAKHGPNDRTTETIRREHVLGPSGQGVTTTRSSGAYGPH